MALGGQAGFARLPVCSSASFRIVLIEALSTGHKIGLGLVGAAFVAFALVSAFLLPAFRPDYPGKRGLPAFLTLTAALFVGMMFAVFFFGREPSEGRAEGGSTGAEGPPTSTPAPPAPPGVARREPKHGQPGHCEEEGGSRGKHGFPRVSRRRGRDLNPRRTFRPVRDFQSRSLDRSDTSPDRGQSTPAGIRRPHGQSPRGLQTAPASGAFGPLGHLSGPGSEYPGRD